MKTRSTRALSLPLVVALVVLAMAPSAAAICPSQTMEGRWHNVDPNGLIRSVQIDFPCCDTAPSSCVPTPKLQFNMPCGSAGNCTLSAVALETFFNGHQFSRLDSKNSATDVTRHFVVLSLDDERLLIHTTLDFPNGAGADDFTIVEYFEKRRCVMLYGREHCFASAIEYIPRQPRRAP